MNPFRPFRRPDPVQAPIRARVLIAALDAAAIVGFLVYLAR
jgi:hypothetical protein